MSTEPTKAPEEIARLLGCGPTNDSPARREAADLIKVYGDARAREGAMAVTGALSDGQTERLHRALGTAELRTVARDFIDYCDMMLYGGNCPACGGKNEEGEHDEGTLCDVLKKALG